MRLAAFSLPLPLPLLLVAVCCAQEPVELAALFADEDARLADASRWEPRLNHDDPALRALAARAVGRIRDTTLAPFLVARLGAEPAADVRAELAFALGQLGEGREALEAACGDDSLEVRARAVEALGKLPAADSSAACLGAALDGEPVEVAAALLASARAYGRRVQPPPQLPEALRAALVAAIPAQLEGELTWQASYALSEVVGLADEAGLMAALGADDASARLFAARGLGRRESLGGEAREALHARLEDPDPHAASAAAWALGKHPDPASQDALRASLEARTESRGFHVRAAALLALAASFPERPGAAWLAVFEASTADPSGTVRRAALGALAGWGALTSAHVTRFCGPEATPADRQSLAQAAGALGALPPELSKALRDAPLKGADRAALAEALVVHDRSWLDALRVPQPGRGFVQAVLEASALGSAGRLSDVAALALHYRHALPRARQGDLQPTRDFGDPLAWGEARAAVVSAVQAVVERERFFAPFGPEGPARALLTLALDDPEATVREAAADALGALYGERPEVSPGAPLRSSVPRNPRDTRAPRTAVLHTELGPLTLELLSGDAPRHVKSFARLAEAGFFNGLTVHRVVSGFVVQGLCPLGNGWGTGGVHLNDEINPVPYLRGAVGMPSSGPDTAGCQLFVTHVPTPHLDGNYTVYARVTDGWDVLDSLDLDHVIQRVELSAP